MTFIASRHKICRNPRVFGNPCQGYPKLQLEPPQNFIYSHKDQNKPIYTERRLENQISQMTTTILTATLCCVLLYAVRILWANKSRAVLDVNRCRSLDQLPLRFDAICRNILDPKALTFLTENAPAYVITSYRIRQRQLAQFSLQVAGSAALRSIAGRRDIQSPPSIRHVLETSLLKAEAGFLVVVCFVGRIGLWIFECLGSAIPRSVHSWLPSKVLSAIGATFSYVSHGLGDDTIIETNVTELDTTSEASHRDTADSSVTDDVRGALERALPNDISRMIYVATLRDNNTGGYFHPDLARRFTLGEAHRAMSACHQEIYERLVSLDLEDLTDQLDIYFGSVRAPKARSIENWRKLRAYRATVPIHADDISVEILFMKIDVALAVLEARLPTTPGN